MHHILMLPGHVPWCAVVAPAERCISEVTVHEVALLPLEG